jgi:hypothetical protein
MGVRGGALVTALAAVAASSSAFGQVQLPGAGPGTYGVTPTQAAPELQSVSQRPHPEYDALGIRAGSFIVFPTADLSENYDSNVYAIPTGVKSDFYTELAPDVAVDSNWNNHALDFDVGSDTRRYNKQVSENTTDAHAAVNGRLDYLRDIYFLGGLKYQRLHEDRTSPDSLVGQKNPTKYQVAGAGLGYVHESGRLGFRIDGDTNFYSYDNAQTATGATVVETDRNRVEYEVKPRLQYEIIPGYNAFVQASGNWRTYQAKFDQNGFQRDSSGWEVDAGTAIELTRLIVGEIYAGYLSQSYTDSRLRTASGVGFGSNLLWSVTELTSVKFTAQRAVQETIVTNTVGTTVVPAASDLQSNVGVSVEHELLRNVLLTAGVGYTRDDFQGISRTDDSYSGSAGGRYLINRYLSANLNFTYTKRDSSQSINNFDRELVMAQIHTQF